MKYQHIQWKVKNPFYVHLKKHKCPYCGVTLKTQKVSKIVNSNSEEAKNFDFQSFDTFMIGNVKFIWTEFLCPNCNRHFSIDEMKKIEQTRWLGEK